MAYRLLGLDVRLLSVSLPSEVDCCQAFLYNLPRLPACLDGPAHIRFGFWVRGLEFAV